jgi:hypothetical protein
MTIGTEILKRSDRKRETNELAQLRRELCAERLRVLVMLKDARDGLCPLAAGGADRSASQLILAFKIVITIVERENFMEMKANRIPVVLRRIENRLSRLGELLGNAAQRALRPPADSQTHLSRHVATLGHDVNDAAEIVFDGR